MDKQDELAGVIAEASNPRLFSADVDISHRAASPYTVAAARRYAIDARVALLEKRMRSVVAVR